MLYTVVLHIDVVDPAALDQYVKTIIIPEYCKQPEKVTTVPTKEALWWAYNPGDAYFPGTVILNSSITMIDDMPRYQDLPDHALAAASGEQAADGQVTGAPAFTLPGFVPW
jgi:hypothetical protein